MKLKHNVYLYYLYNFFKTLSFWLPIVFLFLLSKGLNYTELLTLSVFTGAFCIAFEVPSGVFADYFGRKSALFVSAFTKTACLVVYYLAKDFWTTAVAASIFGISIAFESGSDSAFIYDTLRDLRRENEYKKIEGRAFSFRLIGMAFGSFLGGLLAVNGFDVPVVMTCFAFGMSMVVALFFKEPRHRKESMDTNYFTHMKKAAEFTWNHPRVRWLMAFSAVIMTALVFSHKFHQPYMQLAQIDLKYFGFIYLVWLFFGSMASRYAHNIEERIGEMGSLIIIVLFTGLSLVIVGSYVFVGGVAVFMFGQFVWGYAHPVIKDYVNKHVDSYHRATVLSFGGFFGSILQIVFASAIGYVADLYSIITALLIDGVAVLVFGSVLVYLIKSSTARMSS